jgi:low temperature requirement protein LtrA
VRQAGARGAPQARQLNLMRESGTAGRVTNIELFFDLAYVFAVTQLSHYLLAHPTLTGTLRTGLLLIIVWLLWVYTTWVTNRLDPERIAARPGPCFPVIRTACGPRRRIRSSRRSAPRRPCHRAATW